MKVLSVFNNKGGVGKTTLTYHIGYALAELGNKVLMIDADPQCNLTIYSIIEYDIHDIWEVEDGFIDEGFESQKKAITPSKFQKINNEPRSLHYLVMPTQEGTGDLESLPPPYKLSQSLDIIPGRLTLHLFEEKIAGRWTDLYRGEPLALRTITKIRELSERYSEIHGYDYVIIDTSPSLGALNKSVISTVDGFFIPALPDLFSQYGIKNIGKALTSWKAEFDIIYQLISTEKRKYFPEKYVTFLGYTIYNAKKYSNSNNEWNLAEGQDKYQFMEQMINNPEVKRVLIICNKEYADKVTDLALDYLKSQKDQPDPELLKRLNWSKEDMQKFLERWSEAKEGAKSDPLKKKELDAALKSLGLRPSKSRDRKVQDRDDDLKGFRDEGSRVRPPESVREQFEQFRKAAGSLE